MTRSLAAVVFAAAAAARILSTTAEPADIDAGVRAVLARDLKFSTAEFADLLRDRIVRHNLDARSPGEFGVAGAARVRASKDAFLAAVRDIVRFKSDPSVQEIGTLHNPPSVDDLARLTVDSDDFDPASCRLHDCGIRLPAEMIRRVRAEVDVAAPNAGEQAAAWFKRMLIADVAAYMSGGSGRFTQYDDGDTPIRPLEDFDAVLRHMPAIGALAPGLPEHLANFPANRLPGAEDFFYWSKERFGVAPFISVTQVTIVCPSSHTCVMTTKDIYSSRYIDASLAIAVATDAGARGDAVYLVYANRSRAAALKGAFSGVRRSIVERRSRAALDESLKAIKTRLEPNSR